MNPDTQAQFSQPQTTLVPVSTPTPFTVKPAGAWPRFWANAIDGMVLGLPVIIIAFVMSAVLQNSITLSSIENDSTFSIIFAIFYFCYFVYLTYSKGTTVGKDAYGLKVFQVSTDQKITLAQSTIRELIKSGLMLIPLLGGLFYLINGLVLWLSKSKRGIHDRITKTQVMKVQKAWSMKKQIMFFGGYILLLITLAMINSKFFTRPPVYYPTTQNEFGSSRIINPL